MRRGSLFGDVPSDLAGELFTTLADRPGCRIEQIVSPGGATAPGEWYDQDEDEFVLLVSGGARLELDDGRTIELRPGDWVDLPAHLRHRVAWTAPSEHTTWLTVFRPASDAQASG